MADKSKIEWTDATWNPVTGCSHVSEGCRFCYAERLAKRLHAMGRPGYTDLPWTHQNAERNIFLHPKLLDKPLHWKRPRLVFVNSMSDLFHEQVPFEFIARVFGVMKDAKQHTFQVLTKRPERMKEFMLWLRHGFDYQVSYPSPNVWLGVSVEDQRAADERIPLLIETPAAVRFLSCEPLLGPVDLSAGYLSDHEWEHGTPGGVKWVIVGGESGPDARPMHPAWARAIRNQCDEAGVPFFMKQWGNWTPNLAGITEYAQDVIRRENNRKNFHAFPDGLIMRRVGHKSDAGCLLDGRQRKEYPQVTR